MSDDYTFSLTQEQIDNAAEEVARATTEFNGDPTIAHYSKHVARSVLSAIGPQIAGQALRDAANAADEDPEFRDPLRLKADWIRDRADRIEKEAGR